MDLASPDTEYREFSIAETQRVINITRALKEIFPSYRQANDCSECGRLYDG